LPFVIAGIRDLATRGTIGLTGDLALEDGAVRQAMEFHRTLGAYDRFGWHHAGPGIFYVMAIPSWVFGSGVQAEAAGIVVLCAVLSGAVVYAYGRVWGFPGALAACVGMLTWIGVNVVHPAFGPATNPLGFFGSIWNPYVSIFSTFATVAFTVCLLAEDERSLGWMFFAGTIAVQAHIATLLPIALCGMAALVKVLTSQRRERREWFRNSGGAMGIVALVLWLPPITNALLRSGGNLRKIFDFFSAANSSHTWSFIKFGTIDATSYGAQLFSSTNFPLLGQGNFTGAFLVLVMAPVVVALSIGIVEANPLLLYSGCAQLLIIAAAAVSMADISGATFRYLVAWAIVTPLPCWIALLYLGVEFRSQRRLSFILPVAAAAGIAVGLSGPSITSMGNEAVVTATAAIARHIPAGETVDLSTNDAYPFTRFGFVLGVADQLDAEGYSVGVRGLPSTTNSSQFLPKKHPDVRIAFLKPSPEDATMPGFLGADDGFSIFERSQPQTSGRGHHRVVPR